MKLLSVNAAPKDAMWAYYFYKEHVRSLWHNTEKSEWWMYLEGQAIPLIFGEEAGQSILAAMEEPSNG